jgi:hypothetical protein
VEKHLVGVCVHLEGVLSIGMAERLIRSGQDFAHFVQVGA